MEDATGLLEAIGTLVPTCAPEARPLLSGLASRARALQRVHEERPAAAQAALERAEELGRQAEGPEARDFVREIASDLGRLALARERPEEAAAHFLRALELPPGRPDRAQEQADRGALWLQHARAMMALDRPEEADASLVRAFDEGRASGQPQGREAAAMAAMLRARHFVDGVEECRRLLEAARNLGRLSGRPRGREIAATVEARLRELAEE
jgi:tetratricopeptide (TPR) repeat protein